MDFFGHQELARKKSGWLIALFALAVAVITTAVCAAVALALSAPGQDPTRGRAALALTAFATPTLICGAALVRMAQLRAGGSAVAIMLGGSEVDPASDEAGHVQLRNVVEEMAIAAGIPTPRIFVLENEPGLNAFAAGWDTQDAAIAVTRGLLDALDRDQLQGVVAHEFSHIFHGDMRLNIRLMGVLFGIVCIAEAGRVLLRSSGRRVRSDRKGNALPILGLLLMLIGSIGALLASLIRAALSRQREYLADASAVAYSRNPRGIGTALAHIAAAHSRLVHPRAGEASHLYFADGMQRWFGGWTATHPPIEQRIERILPGFLAEQERQRSATGAGGGKVAAAEAAATAAATRPTIAGNSAFAPMVGKVDAATLERARTTLSGVPLDLLGAARDGTRVEGLLLALLQVHAVPAESASPQGSTDYEARALRPGVSQLGREERIALLELAMPTLRRLPLAARSEVLGRTRAAIDADAEATPFAFLLWKQLQRHLAPPEQTNRKIGGKSLASAHADVAIMLSMLAHASKEAGTAASAFAAGAEQVETGTKLQLLPASACTIPQLEQALDRLNLVTPFGKRQLLAACTRVAMADGVLQTEEGELLRALSANFGCPLPPMTSRSA